MSKENLEDIEDLNPLYIRISKKKYAQLLNKADELVRTRGTLQRLLRPVRKSTKKDKPETK